MKSSAPQPCLDPVVADCLSRPRDQPRDHLLSRKTTKSKNSVCPKLWGCSLKKRWFSVYSRKQMAQSRLFYRNWLCVRRSLTHAGRLGRGRLDFVAKFSVSPGVPTTSTGSWAEPATTRLFGISLYQSTVCTCICNFVQSLRLCA